jgi:hypothetical protein
MVMGFDILLRYVIPRRFALRNPILSEAARFLTTLGMTMANRFVKALFRGRRI